MSEVNPNYNPQDPFGNRWEEHPAAVENQLKDEPTIKYGLTATEILKTEYPHIYSGYMAIVEEQLELFSKKHLDYGMSNISAGTLLATEEERAFAQRINNEPLTDTYQDIVNYGIIAQLVERGLWKK